MIQGLGERPGPRVISLDAGASNYLPLLEGPPDSITMRSGVVTLAPGSAVGVHSTKAFEELVIVLEGQGELLITGQEPLAIGQGRVAYCPPQTEHNVVNTGHDTLRYIFVVAKAQD
jgi:quercetin dioxygenase-like cupin family protein